MRAGIALANRCRKRVGILTGGSITESLSHILYEHVYKARGVHTIIFNAIIR